MKIKITFVIPSLRPGGAERIVSYIAQNLDTNCFEVTLIVIGFEKDRVYQVDNIEVIYLNKKRVLHAFFSLFKYTLFQKPNIVISAISHLNIMMGIQSYFFSKVKYIGREANVKSVLKKYATSTKGKFSGLNFLSKIGYRGLDKIICQSNDMANDFIQYKTFPVYKLIIINNPISKKLKRKKSIPPVADGVAKLITVGRLVPQKGHIRILEALALLNVPFEYLIIGDGPEKSRIVRNAKRLGIYENINFIPYTKRVFDIIATNHLYLQGSFVEGFPNALLESCAIGTPAIVYEAPGGINEIIINGVNGYIVKDIDDFFVKTEQILKQINDFPPEKVSHSVYEKFNSDKIISDYENLFKEIVSN